MAAHGAGGLMLSSFAADSPKALVSSGKVAWTSSVLSQTTGENPGPPRTCLSSTSSDQPFIYIYIYIYHTIMCRTISVS